MRSPLPIATLAALGLATITTMAAAPSTASAEPIAGEAPTHGGTWSHGRAWTAPVPDGAPAATQYSATVQGEPIGLYADTNGWDEEIAFGQFDFTGSVTVSVTVEFEFRTFQIAPSSTGISGTRDGQTITFELGDPTNVTLIFDGQYQGSALHLFGNAPDHHVPDRDDPDVIWIEPGYYDAPDVESDIVIGPGQTLYLAPGAYINGRVIIDGVEDVSVRGRGVISLDHTPDEHPMIPLTAVDSSDVRISGIIVSRMSTGWSSTLDNVRDVRIDNYKVVSPQYASTDALGLINVQDVRVTNSFLRSADDNIPIKGIVQPGYDPAHDPAQGEANRDIEITRSQFWSDANNVITMGAETQAVEYENIRFHDNDVLYSYDDRDHHGELSERAVMSIASLNATHFHDITFADIRIEQAERLIALSFQPSFWFGTLPGNLSWDGSISDITFRNIEVIHSTGSSQIRMEGWDEDHRITDITLDRIRINGRLLCSSNDPHLWLNSLVSNVQLRCGHHQRPVAGPVNVPPEEDYDPDRFSAARDFGAVQGVRGWRFLTRTPGSGPVEMAWDTDLARWRGPGEWDALWADPERLYLHPDDNEIWVQWTAPRDGTIEITGTVAKFDTSKGDGVRAAVYHDDERIWPVDRDWMHIAFDDASGADHADRVQVSEGDVISFRLDQRRTADADSTTWNPSILYADEEADDA